MSAALSPQTPAELWSKGAAFIDGDYVPLSEAKISVLDWGFTRSDVTDDVVHVWKGSFFRLADHLDRFHNSMAGLRLSIPHARAEMTAILSECVRRTGQRDAYVAMLCTRGMPTPGLPRLPQNCTNHRFIAYALPFVWIYPPEQQEQGIHVVIAKTPRIAPESVDPTLKNYHWGDMTRALFEAQDRGADNVVLLGQDGYLTEGPGFNVFAVIDGAVICPDRGALEGITRKSVLELCADLGIPGHIGRITAEQFRDADEAFLCSTAGGIMPISRIDDRYLANGKPGPLSMRLRQRYWEKHEQGWHATPIDYDL
jgi:branched-chain amino acid aminotransferase